MDITTDRRIFLVAGAPRSGKSYHANGLLKAWLDAGNFGFVYNLGKPYDFAAAEPAHLWSKLEHEKYIRKTKGKDAVKEWSEDGRPFRHFSRGVLAGEKPLDIRTIPALQGKALKTPRLGDALEASFFDAVYKYWSQGLFIFDDARPIFRHGLSAEHLQIFSRANHCGAAGVFPAIRAAGMDFMIIVHSLDQINPDLFDYATNIVLFRCQVEPIWRQLDNPELAAALRELHFELLDAPPYTRAEVDLRTGECFIIYP